MLCALHFVEYLLVSVSDWLIDKRLSLHLYMYGEDYLDELEEAPLPAVMVSAPLPIIVVAAPPPSPNAIPVYDRCAYCALIRVTGACEHCPRCGCQVLEQMPEQYMHGVS